MLKFIKHHMETILGIEIFPMVSFIMFFLFFIAVTYWVIKLDKNHVMELENLPLENSKNQEGNGSNK